MYSPRVYFGAESFVALTYAIGILIVIFTGWRLFKTILTSVRLYSYLVQWFSCFHDTSWREDFRGEGFVEMKVFKSHTHPTAAAMRSVANIMIDRLIYRLGFSPFSISMSNRDIRSGIKGTRDFWFAKDLSMPLHTDRLNSTHMIKLIDVDYYVDMPKILSYGLPIIIYTFQPILVADSVPDGRYYIQDDEVRTFLNGGSNYSHPIWDYNTDCLVVDYWWGSRVYLVESKTMTDKTRRVYALCPARTVYGPLAWFIPGYRLRRRKFSHGPLNVNLYNDSESGLHISFSRNPCLVAADLPYKVFQTAIFRCSMSKDPSISDVERIFRMDQSIVDPCFCAGLFIMSYKDLLRYSCSTDVHTVAAIDQSNYQTLTPLVTEDGKPTVRNIGPQYSGIGVAPSKSHNNDNSCVEGRVNSVRNKDIRPPPFYFKCVTEFLLFIIPDRYMHTGVPHSQAYVEQLQNRPTQRSMNDRFRFFSFLQKTVVTSFQKSEVYSKVTHPRNISTLNTDHRLRYGSFIYAWKDYIKVVPWYAFSKHPKIISDRVYDLAQGADWLIPTDFSKWDGTHGKFLADFELSVLLRFFSPTYHREVKNLHQSQFKVKAVTKTGVFYDTGYTRLSGSSDTSDFNTLGNALVAYIALRHVKEPVDAYNCLGIYGGDDGLTSNIDAKLYEKVSTKLGLCLKAECVRPGECVPFLGRVFLDPWSSTVSICDVRRRVASLHLSVTPKTVPPKVALANKAFGYLITDPNTPFISHWARKILDFCKIDTKYKDLLRCDNSWFSQFDDPFYNPDPTSVIAWTKVAEMLEVEPVELANICTRLFNSTSLEEMDLGIVFNKSINIEIPVAMGGQVLKPKVKRSS